MAILTPNSSYEVVIRIFHSNLQGERKKQTKQAPGLLLQSKSLKEEALLEGPWAIPLPCPPPLPGTAPTAAACPDWIWAGIKISGLLSALALSPPVKLSAMCNVRLFMSFMLSSYSLLQRPRSKISNFFQIVFFLPSFSSFSTAHTMSLTVPTPVYTTTVAGCLPPANYQLLCSLQKGSIPACYSFCFSSLQWLWLLGWRVIK